MDHLAERRLHEYVGHSPSRVLRAEDGEHLLTCPQCARKFQELQSLWDAMGSWQVRPHADLTQRIVQAARQRTPVPGRQNWARPAAQLWLHRAAAIAASVLIGTSVGFLAGRSATQYAPAPSAVAASTERSAAAGAYLEVLNAPSVGLANCVALADSDNTEQAR